MSQDEQKQLIQDVKDYLKISWIDATTDKNLLGMIKRGMAYLNNISGTTLNFIEEDLPRALLFDYVRYANSQALEVFSLNFLCELTDLHYSSQAALIKLDARESGISED